LVTMAAWAAVTLTANINALIHSDFM